jgi:DNA-binding transcriptional LysR family regulator
VKSASLRRMGSKKADFDLNLIRVFEALMRTKSATAAANELCCGQPAISHALSRLREAFKDRLFIRRQSGMVPTPYAIELAHALDSAQKLIERSLTEPEEFDAMTSEREFNIVMDDISNVLLLPDLVSHLRQVGPGITLNIRELSAQETGKGLRSGSVDLAIGYLPSLKGGFHQQKVQSEKFVCMMRADHPAANQQLTVTDLKYLSHALVNTRGDGYNIEAIFEKARLKNAITLKIAHYLAVPTIVSTTDMVVTIPSQLAEVFGETHNFQLVRHPLNMPKFEICQYWHARYDLDPANQWLRRTAANLFGRKKGARGGLRRQS